MRRPLHTTAKHIDFVICDIVSIVLSFLAAFFIRIKPDEYHFAIELYRNIGLMLLGIYLVATSFSHAHTDILKRSVFRELWNVVIINAEMLSVVMIIMFAVKSTERLSRIMLGMFFVIDILMMFAFRLIRKAVLLRNYQNGKNTSKSIVITYESTAAQILQSLQKNDSGYHEFKGLVLLGENESRAVKIRGVPVIKMDKILDYVKENAISEAYIFAKHGESGKLMSKFMIMGLTVNVGLNLELRNLSNVNIEQVDDYTLVTSSISRATIGELFIKRLFDILVSIVGLIITGIVTLFVAPRIKKESKGPVFFVQNRVGKNGKLFKIYKFRTMYVDADKDKASLLKDNQMKGPIFKIEDDPRIFPFGKFMRKTSLDELPQFLNILLGDMSLVGTRPPTLDEFEQYRTHHMSRLAMKPGLTGMWQVSGRSDIRNFEEIVRLDNDYIRNFSLGLDFKIIMKTILAVFTMKGSK